MRKIILLLQGIVVIFASVYCTAQNNVSSENLAFFIQGKLDSLYEKEKFPGILVAIRKNGKNEFYTAGYAQPDLKKKFDTGTVFEIGSITKTFTAYVLLSVLRDQQLSDTISILSFLPDSVQQNKNLETISFLKLMNHTSGLPRLPENMILKEGDMQPYQMYDSKLLFEYLKKATPAENKKSSYSNLGMALAGVLAERISGKSYAELLDEYIFLPFKIVDAGNSIAKSDNKSQGYFNDAEKTDYWNMNVMAPAGGIKCNATEMLRYLSCMSKPFDNTSAAIIESLLKQTASINNTIKVCRAWHTLQQHDKPVIYWHNGGTYGFSTFSAFIKDTDQVVMIVINRFNSNNISDKLGFTIMNKLLE